MVMEPELIKEVLIKSFKNFRDNEFAGLMSQDDDPLFSRNPFFLKGEEWKEKRAEITPAFTANRLKVMYPLVEEVQGQMVKYINEKISTQKTPFDARELCTLYTIDVVAKAIYGIDAKSFVGDKSEIREIVRRLFAPSGLFILKMFMVASLPFLKNFFNMRFTPVDIEHFFINLMKDSISYREKNNVKRDDFLDYLLTLKAKKGLQEIDMASHTISFFTDGTETSANAISHTLYEVKTKFNFKIY
jgi:cytochrome P450